MMMMNNAISRVYWYGGFILMNGIDEIIYKETQKAAYEEQCEQGFVHQEQQNEDYFEGLNDYLDGTMSIWN